MVLSCDSLVGVNITEKSQMERLQEELGVLLNKDARIYEISFTSADERVRDVMGTAVINYTIPTDKETKRSMIVNLESRTISRDEPVKERKGQTDYTVQGTLLQNINLSDIPVIITEATKLLESHYMSFAGVRQFSILCEGENNQLSYHFTIDGQPNGSGITSKGRFSAIYYYEVYFTSGTDGNIAIKIDDQLKTKRSGI